MLKDVVEGIKLTREEKLIAEARGNGPSFEDLPVSAREVLVDEIMLRIASICGCSLPNTEFFAKYIADEISIFILKFGYGNLAGEEIFLAFRINCVRLEPVHFTGNCVNVDHISKVLAYYFDLRNLLDKKIKNKIDGYEL